MQQVTAWSEKLKQATRLELEERNLFEIYIGEKQYG